MTTDKQKTSSDDLLESIYSEHGIRCDLCNNETNEFNTDEYFFAERLFKLGWRIKKEITCCPNCAKKNLKL